MENHEVLSQTEAMTSQILSGPSCTFIIEQHEQEEKARNTHHLIGFKNYLMYVFNSQNGKMKKHILLKIFNEKNSILTSKDQYSNIA